MLKKHSKPTHSNNHQPRPTRKRVIIAVIALNFLLQYGFTFLNTGSLQVLSYASEMNISNLLSGTNSNRTSNGLAPLTINYSLNNAAQAKAQDMINNQYWAHVSPSGTTPWYFFNVVGYNYAYAGENLAKGFLSSSATITGWMNSPGHRANILNSNFSEVGFGVINGNLQGEDVTVVVALYGKNRNAQVTVPAPTAVPTQNIEVAIQPTVVVPPVVQATVQPTLTPKPVTNSPVVINPTPIPIIDETPLVIEEEVEVEIEKIEQSVLNPAQQTLITGLGDKVENKELLLEVFSNTPKDIDSSLDDEKKLSIYDQYINSITNKDTVKSLILVNSEDFFNEVTTSTEGTSFIGSLFNPIYNTSKILALSLIVLSVLMAIVSLEFIENFLRRHDHLGHHHLSSAFKVGMLLVSIIILYSSAAANLI